MANTQTTVIAASTDGASTGSAIVVAGGSSITVGLFVASGTVQPGMNAWVLISTPGAANKEVELNHLAKQKQINGPATFNVQKSASGTAFGVYTEA